MGGGRHPHTVRHIISRRQVGSYRVMITTFPFIILPNLFLSQPTQQPMTDLCVRGEEPRGPSRVQRLAALEARREYLRNHKISRQFAFEPAALWALLMKHHYRGPDPNALQVEALAPTEVRITFGGFRAAVYELLFSGPDDGMLTEEDKERYFFKHPFLSPKAFLQYERHAKTSGVSPAADEKKMILEETVEVVHLYAYAAKKMLLYRMRVMLELVASVPPPSLRSPGDPAPLCPPSPLSPLSNGLTAEDVEEFIRQLIPNLRVVRDMPPWLEPYYLCHASRKIMMPLDPRGVGAISIETLMTSRMFSELTALYEGDITDAVVPFLEGCIVELSLDAITAAAAKGDQEVPTWLIAMAEAADDSDYMFRAEVDMVGGSGNELDDLYLVSIEQSREALGSDTRRARPKVFDVKVPRGDLKWCPATTERLPPHLVQPSNWFSLPLMFNVYEQFVALDVDGDGMLTIDEFSRYAGGSYTHLAVSRVFEEHVSGGTNGQYHQMDFKTFLTFVVATEYPHLPSSQKYLWSILDLDHTVDRINVSALRQFCKEVSANLRAQGLMSISASSILSEVVDMVNPRWHEWVTRTDLESCRQYATVVPILLNWKQFHLYDCREHLASQSAMDECPAY